MKNNSFYNTYFSADANEYCENGGFDTRDALFNCILQGNIEGLPSILDAYNLLLKALIKSDLDYAHDVILFVFAQLQVVAIFAGIPAKTCYVMQSVYFQAMDLATDIDSMLLLIANQCHDFTQMVHDMKSAKQYSSLVKSCLDYIRANLYERITIADIAEAVHHSPSHISNKFKAETGISLNHCIRQEKIREAKLLLKTNISLADVATSLGFASQSHFSDSFKKETGITPMQYKKNEQ